jgi:hypothetical protein
MLGGEEAFKDRLAIVHFELSETFSKGGKEGREREVVWTLKGRF